jgi:hypothetical protein
MAQRPSFDLNSVSTADKILVGGTVLFLIDSILPWQRACAAVFGPVKVCGSASMWGGDGSWAGVLAGILALLLLVGVGLQMANVQMPAELPVANIMAGLTLGTVVFGLLKFILIITNHSYVFAYIGLILLLAIAYGGYMKMQEPKVASATPPPPPPAPGTGGLTP